VSVHIFQLTEHNKPEGLNPHSAMVIARITLFMLTDVNEKRRMSYLQIQYFLRHQVHPGEQNICCLSVPHKSWESGHPLQEHIITYIHTRVGTLIVATIYLQLIQNRYMFQSFTVHHCSHQHCVQPVASDVDVVGYL